MNKHCVNNFKSKFFEKKSEELYFYCTLYDYYSWFQVHLANELIIGMGIF